MSLPCGGLVSAIHPKINISYQACRHYHVYLFDCRRVRPENIASKSDLDVPSKRRRHSSLFNLITAPRRFSTLLWSAAAACATWLGQERLLNVRKSQGLNPYHRQGVGTRTGTRIWHFSSWLNGGLNGDDTQRERHGIKSCPRGVLPPPKMWFVSKDLDLLPRHISDKLQWTAEVKFCYTLVWVMKWGKYYHAA